MTATAATEGVNDVQHEQITDSQLPRSTGLMQTHTMAHTYMHATTPKPTLTLVGYDRLIIGGMRRRCQLRHATHRL